MQYQLLSFIPTQKASISSWTAVTTGTQQMHRSSSTILIITISRNVLSNDYFSFFIFPVFLFCFFAVHPPPFFFLYCT